MLNAPRRERDVPDEEGNYFDPESGVPSDWGAPDDVLELNQPVEELGGPENQSNDEDDDEEHPDESPNEHPLVPLWDLL